MSHKTAPNTDDANCCSTVPDAKTAICWPVPFAICIQTNGYLLLQVRLLHMGGLGSKAALLLATLTGGASTAPLQALR